MESDTLTHAQQKFIAWVPCLSGKLLFRHFSSGHPKATKTLLIKHDESIPNSNLQVRSVILSEDLDLKDFNLQSDGKYQFTIAGTKLSNEGSFIGNIFVLPQKIAKANSEWNNIYSELQQIQQKAKEGNHIKGYFKQAIDKLINFKHPEYYSLEYEIDEHGFTTLKYQTPNHSADLLDTTHIKTVTRQSFYYLKYSLHKHKHHQHDDDSLTTIHELPDDTAEIGDLLIKDLLTSIVDLTRKFEDLGHEGLYEARGIVAYTKSLIESCHRKGFLDDKEYKHKKYYFENISSSLKIKAEKMERHAARKATAWSNARSILLFFISIVAPIMFLFRDEIIKKIKEGDPELTSISTIVNPFVWIFSSGLHIIIALFIISIIFISYLTYKTKLSSPLIHFQFYRDFVSSIFSHLSLYKLVGMLLTILGITLIIKILDKLKLTSIYPYFLDLFSAAT
ncbi:MAG: hypothetical protein KZQ98_19790 [Candidatus Thiodiazotropha sp. (ex Lucinoma borealis)]|nr:hypothetical protein [Candidatus Thiodiazotropha sp. (ex Lucinoma borealis)]